MMIKIGIKCVSQAPTLSKKESKALLNFLTIPIFQSPSIKYDFRQFNFTTFFKTNMSAFINKCHKIFRSIIIFNFIKMMTLFSWKKIAIDLLFNYKTMFSYVSFVITKRMFRFMNKNIAIFIYKSPTLPRRIFTSLTNNTHFSFSFFGKFFPFPITLMSFNKSTKFISHNILHKIKAALRALNRKRLSFQAPITASFRHKKFAFCLVSIIIALFLCLSSPLYAQSYTAKEINILTYAILFAETWEEAFDLSTLVGDQARTTVRKWKLKARENDDLDLAFDYNFSSVTPTYFATNAGQGFGQDGTALPQKIFIRTRASNIIVELIYYQ